MANVERSPRGRMVAEFRFTGMPALSRETNQAVNRAAEALGELPPVQRQGALLALCDRFRHDDDEIDRTLMERGGLPGRR